MKNLRPIDGERSDAVPKNDGRNAPRKKLSVVIPVYCEEDSIDIVLERVLEVVIPLELEIIIVDDASSDRSPEIIRALGKKHPQIKTAFHDKNQGKGAALRTGFSLVTGDTVVIQDADLEYNPSD